MRLHAGVGLGIGSATGCGSGGDCATVTGSGPGTGCGWFRSAASWREAHVHACGVSSDRWYAISYHEYVRYVSATCGATV